MATRPVTEREQELFDAWWQQNQKVVMEKIRRWVLYGLLDSPAGGGTR